MSVGFIGLGIMGRGMALNLMKSGKTVVVWNRTADKCAEFVAAGAIEASTPAEVVAQCDVTYSMLSTPEAAAEVFYGEHGTLAGVTPGKKLVDCATLDAATMQRFYADTKAKGGSFLEAPVSGSKGPAEAGSLIMLCAGDKALFDEVEGNDLKLVGKASYFLGDIGRGSRMKIAVNMCMGEMMVAFSEGIALTEACDLDPSTFVEIVGLGAMACPMYKGKGPNMVANTFSPQFPLKHQQKDVNLACDLGKEVGVALPMAEAANAVFKKAVPDHGDDDFCAVVTAVRK